MPWLETNPMDERGRFIVELDEGMYSVAGLSARFGVSRQRGDRWRRRDRRDFRRSGPGLRFRGAIA